MKSIIQTPTPNLKSSIEFYTRLGFIRLEDQSKVRFTDGMTLVEVNPERYARAGVRLLAESWYDAVTKIGKRFKVHELDNGYLLSDPSNVWVYLEETDADIDFSLAEASFSLLGNYAGLSFESADMARSSDLWTGLG